MSMNMDRFHSRHDSVAANSGMEFADVPRLIVQNGAIIRLVGDFQDVWEHFVDTKAGPRPYYCEGPESDCPLCQVASRLSFSDNEQEQKVGSEIKAKQRFYFNALDRSPAGKAWHQANNKAKILTQSEKALSIGSMLFKNIGNVVKMRHQQGQVDDPSTFDIMLSKSGSGMKTQYGAQFTGDVTPLTEAELAYELWPIDQMAKITPRVDREAIAKWIMGEGADPTKKGSAETETQQAQEVKGPVQAQAARPAQQMTRTPTASPAPAVAPGQIARVAQPQEAKPAKLVVKPKSQYQDTSPRAGVDESTHMTVPCSDCSSDLMIDMEDDRDLQCWKCGKIYQHPSKG